MAIEIKDGGTYRIYPIRLQGVALNAYGSSATTSGQNVCLYKDTPSDTMQDWIIRAVDLDEGSYQIHSANNTEFVLDRSNGVLRTSRNNNAHLCELSGTDLNDSEVMITTPAGDSQGHVFIKLKAAINGQVLYLTSTNYSSSDSTPSSITSSMALNTNGNVYWAPQSSATRAYQYWRLEKQGDSGETPTPDPEPGTYQGKMTLAELKAKFPHGKFWNHVGSEDNNQDSYTDSPCPVHTSEGSDTCNDFELNGHSYSSECLGFAEKCGYDFSGINPRNESKWVKSEASSSLDNLKAGDIVRYYNNSGGKHAIFVTEVNGTTVTFGDCNGTRNLCQIRWGATIDKSTLKDKFVFLRKAPFALK